MTTVSKRPRRKLAPPTEKILKAMNHPMRFAALSILSERVASPSDIAKELGETVGAVAYHVRVLRDMGALELVDTARRRGATESYYRATVRPWYTEAEYNRLPGRRRREVFAPLVQTIVDDAVRSLAHGGFDGPDPRAARLPMLLDDKGREAVVALLDRTAEKLQAIQAQVNQRVGAEVDTAEVALLHFAPTSPAEARRNGR